MDTATFHRPVIAGGKSAPTAFVWTLAISTFCFVLANRLSADIDTSTAVSYAIMFAAIVLAFLYGSVAIVNWWIKSGHIIKIIKAMNSPLSMFYTMKTYMGLPSDTSTYGDGVVMYGTYRGFNVNYESSENLLLIGLYPAGRFRSIYRSIVYVFTISSMDKVMTFADNAPDRDSDKLREPIGDDDLRSLMLLLGDSYWRKSATTN